MNISGPVKKLLFRESSSQGKFEVTRQVGKLVQGYSKERSLDIGCGTGAYFELFKGEHIIGLDLTEEFLKEIDTSGSEGDKISLLLADIRHLPFKDNVFSFVLCSDVLEYLKDQTDIAIHELERVSKGNGIIVVSVPSADCLFNWVRWLLYGKRTCAQTDDISRFTGLGDMFTKNDLRQYGFSLHGCLGWVTGSRLRLQWIAGIFDFLAWHFPSLGGTLIGIKRVEC